MSQTRTFAECIALKETGAMEFESINNPESMGHWGKNAFGGNTMALAINAGYQQLAEDYQLYSVMGYFLGPSRLDRALICNVREIRKTRTFCAREVELSQLYDGKRRKVMVLLMDFQMREPATMMSFSAPPALKYSSLHQAPSLQQLRSTALKEGRATAVDTAFHEQGFALKDRYFEQRACVEGVFGQTLYGVLQQAKTTQDDLPVTAKTSADWFRAVDALSTRAENMSALAFMMDAALAFVPLAHDHSFFTEAGACSTLDFAFRVFVNDLKVNDWHLREMKTIAGGEGRTYNEARLWDERGKMVASMTQQCILRPKPKPTIKL